MTDYGQLCKRVKKPGRKDKRYGSKNNAQKSNTATSTIKREAYKTVKQLTGGFKDFTIE